MHTNRTHPFVRIRVIGAAPDVDALLPHLIARAEHLFGPRATCRKQIRTAHSPGQVRAYLTVTRKESPIDVNSHG